MPRPRRILLLTVGVLALAVVGLAAWASWTGRERLRTAESELRVAQQQLRAAEVEPATLALRRAADAAATADARLGSLPVRALAALPGVGNSLDVGAAVARSAREVTAAAVDVVAVIDGLPAGLDSLLPTEGGLPVAPLRELADPLAVLDERLGAASDRLADTPSTFLLAEVADARAAFTELNAQLQGQVTAAASLTRVLPAFLGSDGPRTYFLGVANPAELRAVGGFLGAHAVLTIDHGRMRIGTFGPTWDLPSLEGGVVEAPDPSFAARYDVHDATGLWSNINMSPDFPTVATAIERLWVATHDDEVDGTVLVDPFALQALLRLTGPTEVPETGEVLRPATVIDYVTNTSFADLGDPRERKEAIGDVAAASLAAFLSGEADAPLRQVVRTLGDAAGGHHLLVHAVDPEEQAAFEQAGLGGRMADPPRGVFFRLTYNSATASKVDYWLDEHVAVDVRLLDDGRAELTTTVELDNGAPTEGVSWVVGPNAEGLEAGDNRLWISFYCGSRCDPRSATSSSDEDVTTETELGMPVTSTWVTIPSGDGATMQVSAIVDDAWWIADGRLVVEVTHQDQAMVREGTLDIGLEVPEGFEPAELPEDARVEGDRVRWSRTGRGDVSLRMELRPGPSVGSSGPKSR